MSIVVRQISKKIGQQQVLTDISFQTKEKRILGLLGPNGAGKSTLMKIIAGVLSADSGQVNAQGTLGYLPEQNPMYPEMYVLEYLSFCAHLHKLPEASVKIDDALDRTGLNPEKHKKISQLSKGYKQRVGLAQAILHDPDVLMLDEPTSGLDPKQLQDIRMLIKNLGKTKTIMFSSHIMQEVAAVCDDIILLDQGKIVAAFALESMEESFGTDSLEEIFIKFTQNQEYT